MTLLNNWENTYFKFDEKLLAELMKEAKHLGVDMFLLDDGWFGNKHPRNSDNAGLGDWEVMKSKLPGGIRTREIGQRSRSKIRYLDRTGDDKPQK